MKIVAIDFGERRIGVATCDPLQIAVRPLYTIDRKVEDTYSTLRDIISSERPEKIIFGLPLDGDGNENEKCQTVRRFAEKLRDKLELYQAFDFQDESYSSVRTHSHMLKHSSKKKRVNKKNIDKIAACFILEDYIRESQGVPPMLY